MNNLVNDLEPNKDEIQEISLQQKHTIVPDIYDLYNISNERVKLLNA